jgi:hypothetical protein
MAKRGQGREARYDQNKQLGSPPTNAILKNAALKTSSRDQNERIKVGEGDIRCKNRKGQFCAFHSE